MSQSCTIYCKCLSWETILRVSKNMFKDVEIRTSEEGKESLEVKGRRGSLRLTNMQFLEQADSFAQLRLSTYMEVDRIETSEEAAKLQVLAHIEACESIIGVVAEPGFDADKRFNRAVFCIAKEADGIVFN